MYLYKTEDHIGLYVTIISLINFRLLLARPIVNKVILGIHSCPSPPTNQVRYVVTVQGTYLLSFGLLNLINDNYPCISKELILLK